MGLYMRAVLREWNAPPFDELAGYLARSSQFRLRPVCERGGAEFEVVSADDTTVLAADLTTCPEARAELNELDESLDGLDGSPAAVDAVRSHLREATAVVGMQVFSSVHEQSVAAANALIEYLECRPRVLTQVDTVGWYDGPQLILREPD